MNIPKVIKTVVSNDLCIGCGLCVYKCPNKALEMKWNEYGFLTPTLSGNCDTTGNCVSVCPFNPCPDDEVKTEIEIAEIFLKASPSYHPKIGKYHGIYAGYSKQYRLTSSSGGIATYVFTELLNKGIVDYIFSVKESNQSGVHYEYSISSSKEELLHASKTKYFPVTLGNVMPKINELNGKVAIVGVACFIKAIRLAQHKEPQLKEKIPFLVGIICGGVKSRFFTEYLASKTGVLTENIDKPQFRIKDFKSTAGDYSFGCINKKDSKEHTIKMRTVGDMWGTGMFKANACDFCDDVTTELADISLGDAWLRPYDQDGLGTNIIITRSKLAEQLIRNGKEKAELSVESLPLQLALKSQQGSYNHRHLGLGYRINRQKTPIPPKHFDSNQITFDFKLVQLLRRKTRHQSLEIWKSFPNAKDFDKKIIRVLKILRLATRLYHYRKAITLPIKHEMKKK
ncbi:Coenzyme F420 hydrogenase/dehydrogenase, beta subunit C-terminal domain [Sunxiuqinia rutila]|uniref:Coenzyme F420 hydrogenase/dehydrogenase, beta subunit C-terminal domain n=1 Tax=Sunxiuqinia rutila TaxID=1397841 RepID=UPI003D35E4AC